MPSKPLPISAAISQLLRERREVLGLTLRGVEQLSSDRGDRIPASTLARIELGVFDPGVRRLGQLLSLYQLPIQAAGDVLDMEALAGVLPMEKDAAKLRDRALESWRQGKMPEAVSFFLAFRRRVPKDDAHREMRQDAMIAFAVVAGSLGKLHLSRQILDELLVENPAPESTPLIRILIQQSVIWLALGSPVVAGSFVDTAAKTAAGAGPKPQGWVEHQRAHLLIEQRDYRGAAKSLARAAQFYRRAKAPHDEGRGLLTITRLRFEEGKPQEALKAALTAERFAKKHGLNRIRLSSQVDQARALIAMGSADDGKKLLKAVLADTYSSDDNRLSFYTHFYLWQAENALGNPGRASVELQEARYYLKYVDHNSPESRAVRDALAGVSVDRPLVPAARRAQLNPPVSRRRRVRLRSA